MPLATYQGYPAACRREPRVKRQGHSRGLRTRSASVRAAVAAWSPDSVGMAQPCSACGVHRCEWAVPLSVLVARSGMRALTVLAEPALTVVDTGVVTVSLPIFVHLVAHVGRPFAVFLLCS